MSKSTRETVAALNTGNLTVSTIKGSSIEWLGQIHVARADREQAIRAKEHDQLHLRPELSVKVEDSKRFEMLRP